MFRRGQRANGEQSRPKRAHEGADPKFKKEYRALVVSRPCGFLTVLARNAETLRSWDLEIFRIIPIQKGREAQQTTNARYYLSRGGAEICNERMVFAFLILDTVQFKFPALA